MKCYVQEPENQPLVLGHVITNLEDGYITPFLKN